MPVVPISVAYSLMSADHARIRSIAELVEPGLVFADDAGAFGAALDAVAPRGAETLIARGDRPGALRLDDLLATAPGATLDDAFAAVGADTIAKLLFTSGSTAMPKGVINTHRMLCSNQAMLRQIWPFLDDEPPILVDWLPWSHTFGANHNLNLALFNGGTIYIDDGKPAPPLFPRTLAALRDIAPTRVLQRPRPASRCSRPRSSATRSSPEHFFSRLRFMFYAGAALPEALAIRLRELAARVADHDVPLTSSWGTTETAPAATSAHFLDRPDRMHRRTDPGRVDQARAGRARSSRSASPGRTSPPATTGHPSSPEPRSTRRASIAPATRAGSSTSTTRTRACCSTGASPRTSSS